MYASIYAYMLVYIYRGKPPVWPTWSSILQVFSYALCQNDTKQSESVTRYLCCCVKDCYESPTNSPGNFIIARFPWVGVRISKVQFTNAP